MSDARVRQVNKTVLGHEVISKKGAVMKVTKLRLSAKGSAMLRSNSAGIKGKKDEQLASNPAEDCFA
jgi:hypothetical protein